MKKIIIFSAVIIGLFAAIIFVTQYQQKEASKDNPYGKEKLHPETTKDLKDPNYQNIILPDELEKKLEAGEDVTVYFYSPTCPHCKETTPVLMPLAKENNVEIMQYNLLEFEQGWDQYQIEYTPTLIHFEKGTEKDRLVGGQPESEFESFFEKNIKK
ncbi:thiol-disulfide isomerase/thioredoxin [Bacillus ectoiniformans]|uniref:thioredoxin family protein n=1 Tax=Bacillus ectoiniformans TaxID=1494429 RepID=UPI0019582899|nr:thioredoxin family protein [Bacillus ectoiniformans]MBM7647658.1 thiol-disulfide isomerase/thioredoxin [Bacillus ectoiniformans]